MVHMNVSLFVFIDSRLVILNAIQYIISSMTILITMQLFVGSVLKHALKRKLNNESFFWTFTFL